jgi:hypothetical protein
VDKRIKFINPKFNSVLRSKLKNEVTEFVNLDHDELIFLYLNFELTHEQYNRSLNLIIVNYIR